MSNYDSRNSLGRATVALAAANIAVYMIGALSPRLAGAIYEGGVLSVNAVVSDREMYRVVTSMFLHADTQHLFSNTVALLYLGDPIEKRLGALRYLLIYFAAGIAGNLITLAWELRAMEDWSSLGASGAVFGLIGALLTLCVAYRNRMGSITPARVAAMAAYSVYSGFMMENVNNIAHIGGFLAGLVFGALMLLIPGGAGRRRGRGY